MSRLQRVVQDIKSLHYYQIASIEELRFVASNHGSLYENKLDRKINFFFFFVLFTDRLMHNETF